MPTVTQSGYLLELTASEAKSLIKFLHEVPADPPDGCGWDENLDALYMALYDAGVRV